MTESELKIYYTHFFADEAPASGLRPLTGITSQNAEEGPYAMGFEWHRTFDENNIEYNEKRKIIVKFPTPIEIYLTTEKLEGRALMDDLCDKCRSGLFMDENKIIYVADCAEPFKNFRLPVYDWNKNKSLITD